MSDSVEVHRDALGLLNPNKDTFHCWPELLPIFEELNYLQM